ncbi:MAG: threonine/serine exporter family protein [Eubacteriaceae bacterium]|nr:threonine/serine exporter family protein [Eubacteriaceae bacterium]
MIVQLIAAFLGSLGFAFILKIKGKQIIFAGIGGLITWAIYLAVYSVVPKVFFSTLVASLFVGVYAELMARLNKAPTTIFLTASAVPLIPGGKLYYAVYGIVSSDQAALAENGMDALYIALGIVVGFVAIAIITKYINRIIKQ